MRLPCRPGQSLLEGIVAIGVLVTGVIAILTLSIASLSTSQDVESRIVATNLAREALEAVRVIRDSNWLKGCTSASNPGAPCTDSQLGPWDTGLTDGVNALAIPVLNPASLVWTLYFVPGTQVPDIPGVFTTSITKVWRPSSLYRQCSDSSCTTASTPYRRLLLVYAVCRDNSGNETSNQVTCASNKKAGLRVKAIVQWQDGPAVHQVALEDYLYNWRFAPAP